MRTRIGLGTILVMLIVVAVAGALGYQFYREHYVVEKRDGQVLAGVVTAAFTGRNDLRVGNTTGIVQAKAEDINSAGLHTEQIMKAPYSVDYFVDLSKLSLNDYRWNEKNRTLTIVLPPVTVGRPNVDESRRTMIVTKGWWVSRAAAERLTQRVSSTAQQLVKVEAEKPEYIRRARERARNSATSFIRPALAVAGLNDVHVIAQFPDEMGGANSEQWDLTRSLREVLADPNYR